MTTKRISPTANLLRTSRLFALPPPLQRPQPDFTSEALPFSATATLPYPTNAAITTPRSSLVRGDWGLKRPLPLKATTKSSTPTVRIDAIDTIEHITSFRSAGDHVITLKKWQDLNMPLTMSVDKEQSRSNVGGIMFADSEAPGSRKSVFEPCADKTTADGDQKAQRWRFEGPWLAGLSEGEFQRYVERQIKSRRAEFREFIRSDMLATRKADERLQAIDKAGKSQAHTERATIITDAELDDHMLSLRHDKTTLHKLVQSFLDLPTAPGNSLEQPAFSNYFSTTNYDGPPDTHPSAGLSYLRTDAHLANHPIRGPQARQPPVTARVLAPKLRATGFTQAPKIAVAGVVGTDERQAPNFRRGETDTAVMRFNPDEPGGGKVWIHPKSAGVDTKGRIDLMLGYAQPAEIELAEGKWGDEPVGLQSPTVSSQAQATPSESGAYGIASKERSYKVDGHYRDKGPVKSDDEMRQEFSHIQELLKAMETKKRGGS